MSLKKQQKQQQQQQRCYRQRLTDFRRSNTLLIFAVFMASWLDNFLLTVVVPIVPQYIAKLDAIAREKDMMGVTDGMVAVTDGVVGVRGGMMPVTDGMMAVTDGMVTTMERGQNFGNNSFNDDFMGFLFGENDANYGLI